MREIKFRAKAITGEWVTGYLVDTGTYAVINRGGEFIFCFPETIGQYTGLKDNYRREIYEGDILQFEAGKIAPIEFYLGCFYIAYNTMDSEKNDVPLGEFLDDYPDAMCIIIGNIYENPELLKATL